MHENDNYISWQTAEYAHKTKSPDWFWALGIIAVAGAASSALFGNILFAILIVIGGFTLALFAARSPEEVTITLTEKGILLHERLYPYSTIESFWVETDTDPPQLSLQLKSLLTPKLTFPLEDISSDDVRIFLTKHINEKELETVPLSERTADFFGF